MSPPGRAPTAPQLRYLRSLAARTATTFAYPATRAQASREIERLRRLPRQSQGPTSPSDEREVERLTYATAVQPDEVSGYGASASWRTAHRPREAADV